MSPLLGWYYAWSNIHSTDSYSLSTYYVAGIVLGVYPKGIYTQEPERVLIATLPLTSSFWIFIFIF